MKEKVYILSEKELATLLHDVAMYRRLASMPVADVGLHAEAYQAYRKWCAAGGITEELNQYRSVEIGND